MQCPLALKARNKTAAFANLEFTSQQIISRLQRSGTFVPIPWGVAPGYYISRRWRFSEMSSKQSCVFCNVISGDVTANVVFEDDTSLAFLDHRPLFPGHCLLVPKNHFETLSDLSSNLVGPFFKNVQLLARAVEASMEAEGSFVAMNNRVSQSVPHLHVHVVPRRKKDGLKGFFWPRTKYGSEADVVKVQQLIRSEIGKMQKLL